MDFYIKIKLKVFSIITTVINKIKACHSFNKVSKQEESVMVSIVNLSMFW